MPIGLLALACTALYVIPRTSTLGAVLLTGYLGGAVAIQARAVGGVPHDFPGRRRRARVGQPRSA